MLLQWCSWPGGPGVWTPWAVKSPLWIVQIRWEFFWRGSWTWMYFQTSHCAVNHLAVIGIHCLFYRQLLWTLPLDPHQGSAPGPWWGTSVPASWTRPPEPSNPPTPLYNYTYYPNGNEYPLSYLVKCSIVVPSPRSDPGCATAWPSHQTEHSLCSSKYR